MAVSGLGNKGRAHPDQAAGKETCQRWKLARVPFHGAPPRALRQGRRSCECRKGMQASFHHSAGMFMTYGILGNLEGRLSSTVKRLGLASIATAAIALAGSASAATVSYSASVPLTTTDWTVTISLPRFDATLGTLQSVEFQLSGVNRTATRFENRDATPWTTTTGSDVAISVSEPLLGTLVAATPVVRFVNEVEAFDGSLDYGGTSGATNPALDASAAASAVLDAGTDDVSPFVGAGAFSVDVLADRHRLL